MYLFLIWFFQLKIKKETKVQNSTKILIFDANYNTSSMTWSAHHSKFVSWHKSFENHAQSRMVGMCFFLLFCLLCLFSFSICELALILWKSCSVYEGRYVFFFYFFAYGLVSFNFASPHYYQNIYAIRLTCKLWDMTDDLGTIHLIRKHL